MGRSWKDVFSSWGRALLLACAAVPLMLDTHEKLLIRGTNLMTVEDRAITAGSVLLVYWVILALVWVGVRLLACRHRPLPALAIAAAIFGLGLLAAAQASDALYLLLHQACYAARLCESQPVFAHVMFALSATSMPAGRLAALVVALVAGLAFTTGRREAVA